MSNAEPTNPRPDKEIFFEALDLATPEERAALLDAACGNDLAQRRRLEDLLAIHVKQNPFMQEPAAQGSAAVLSAASLTEVPGAQIGRYKLLEKLGEGGFGAVYVAEQKEPVKRRVALKIIKLGMDTRQVVARFEAERQALALMDHPNIAKVLDGGATDTGRLYFVMELVRGVPITRYCDDNNLTTVERLNLFILVCQAIQHAHQKGIIHRDVKPSNIMVALHDGVPVPKVIDFGIAKATQFELTDKTVFTQFQQFIGTPAYISPEQAEMSGLDIDTRADGQWPRFGHPALPGQRTSPGSPTEHGVQNSKSLATQQARLQRGRDCRAGAGRKHRRQHVAGAAGQSSPPRRATGSVHSPNKANRGGKTAATRG